MEGLTPETIRAVVQAMREAQETEYSPEGIRCPLCGAWLPRGRRGTHRVGSWSGGVRYRYHSCLVCMMRFRSRETREEWQKKGKK